MRGIHEMKGIREHSNPPRATCAGSITAAMAKATSRLLAACVIATALLTPTTPVLAEGSRDLYPATYPAGGFRSAMDLRATASQRYMGVISGRQFLYVYAEAGEYILTGSRNRNNGGDVLIYDPQAFGTKADETRPTASNFQCSSTTPPAGSYSGTGLGLIAGRAQELAGPNSADNSAAVAGGFAPCAYRAPSTGIYGVQFMGATSGGGGTPDGSVGTPQILTSQVSAWDVTVRPSATSVGDLDGRVFSYAWIGYTGSNPRPIHFTLHYVTADGYRYRQTMRGIDPNAAAFYANSRGFLDAGAPLYKDVRGNSNTVGTGTFPSGVTPQQPAYPLFFADVDPAGPNAGELAKTLGALGIPLVPPAPQLTNPVFVGNDGGNQSTVSAGGVFEFDTVSTLTYEIVISRDGVDFDPANSLNRALTGTALTGSHSVLWDGRDNDDAPFPAGNYSFRIVGRNGEIHFPMLDIEGNANGGPTLTKLNGGGGNTVYFDDRGYQTRGGTLVGALNGHLCGATNAQVQPSPNHSLIGIDSSISDGSGRYYRWWTATGNAGPDCLNNASEAFGNYKGLDLWSLERSSVIEQPIVVVPGSTLTDVGVQLVVGGSAYPGDTVYGSLVYSHAGDVGTADATGVTYTLLIGTPGSCPAGVDFTLLPSGAAFTYDSATCAVTFTGLPATLSPGDNLSFNFEYTAPATGPVPVAATIDSVEDPLASSPNPPDQPVPNRAEASTDVIVADVATTITVPASAAPGTTVAGSVTFGNLGSATATAEGVTYELVIGTPGSCPADVAFPTLPPGVSASYNPETCAVSFTGMPATLNPGDEMTIDFTYTASPSGSVPVHSGISTGTPETDAANNIDDESTVVQPDFGTCDERMYLAQSATNSTNNTLSVVDTSTNPLGFPALGTGTVVYNAIGYRSSDNYLYGIIRVTNHLVRVGADGSTADLGEVADLPPPASGSDPYAAGEFGPDGRLYVISRIGATRMYAIDVTTRVASVINLTGTLNIADIAWSNGLFYGVQDTDAQLVSISASGQVTNVGTPNGAVVIVATWGASTGFFGNASASSGGGFYQFDLTTGTHTLISASPAPQNADGAHCIDAPIAFNADLAVAKTDGSASYAPGANVVYAITVTNNGPFGVQNASVSDPLPAGITTASWTCTASGGGNCAASGSGAINDIVDLPPAAVATYTLTLTVPPDFTGDLVNTATATNPPGSDDPAPDDNSATDTDTPAPSADLSITKTDGSATYAPGGTITYTITATNAGPSNAVGATVSDTLPAAITGATWTVTYAGGASGPANGSGDVNATVDLPAGGTATFIVTGTVASSASGDLVNTAGIAPPTGTTDPNVADNSATDTDTSSPSADVSIVKSGPATVAAGASISYTLLVSNAGPSAADGATYTDAVPTEITGVAAICGSPTGGAVCAAPSVAGNTVSGSVPTLPAGGSITITISGSAPFGAQTLTNTATATPPTGMTDPDPGNNSSDVDTTIGGAADLAVTKTVDNAAPNVGDTVVFTITAQNLGPDDATGVALTDSLPFGLGFVAATPSVGTYDSATGLWTIGDLALSDSATLTITATVDEPGSLTNTVAVSASDQPDPDTSNNSAAAAVNAGASADIGVSKTVDEAAPNVGANVTFTITATNAGPNDATGVELTDVLPAGLSFVSATPSVGTYDSGSGVWALGALANGASETLTIVATVDQPGSILNTVTVTGEDQFDPNPANNSSGVSVNGQSADLSVTKTVDNATPNVGDDVTFTVTVHNSGPSDATNVALTDALPPSLSLVSATPSQGTYDDATGVWTVGTLTAVGPTSSATLTIVATVTEAGAAANTATVSAADQPDPNTANNSASASVNGNPLADLAVTKSGAATVTPGEDIAYTIVVTNNGPSDAVNVVVNDSVPAGLVFVGNTGDCTNAYPCTFATLAAGASVTITTTVAVPADYTGANPIVNTATASSDTPDPDTTNNQGSAQTNVGQGNADLAIDKQGPAVVASNGAITYTLLIVNHGPSPANGASYSDTLPAGLTAVTASCGGEAGGATCVTQPTVAGGTVSGTIGALPSSGSVVVTINATAPQGPVTLTNAANVAPPSGVNDPAPGNNDDTVGTEVGAPMADLEVEKSGPGSATPGTDVTYTLTVTNHGPDVALSTQLDDPTPAGLTFVSASTPCAAGFPCALGDLAAGGSTIVTVTFSVPANASGSIANTATVTSPTGDPDPSNNASTVTTPLAPSANLVALKTGPATIAAGGALTYTVVVTNNGPSAADGAQFSDPVPAGVTGVAATCAGETGGAVCGAVDVTGNHVTSTITTLPPGATVTFTINGTAPASATTLTNAASVAPPNGTTDPTPGDNDSSVDTEVVVTPLAADLAVSKSGPAGATAGQTISYAIQVVNHGPDAVSDAVLDDPTPAGLEYVSSTAPCAGGFPCALPPLPNGASVTFTVTYTVQAGFNGTIVNTATATSPTVPDPSPNNNESTVTTPVGANPGGPATPVPVDARGMLALMTLLLMLAGASRTLRRRR